MKKVTKIIFVKTNCFSFCSSHGVRAKPPIWQKSGAVSRANEDQEYDEEASKLQEQSTSPRPYSVKVPTLHDLRPGMKNSGRASPNILQRRKKMTRRVSLDDIIKQDKSCNSIPEVGFVYTTTTHLTCCIDR